MSKSSEAVKRWRKNTKQRIIASMGGGCCICGYNKCSGALALHHLDPKSKEFALGSIMANPASWDKIVVELRKCVMVCHNHHEEIHEGLIEVPPDAKHFNESYVELKTYLCDMSACPVCGTMKPTARVTCSRRCASRKSWSANWDDTKLMELKNKGLSNALIAESFGVSDQAVSKRLKKIASTAL